MGDDDQATDARRVLAWIKSRGEATFTRDELARGFKGRLDAEALDAITASLVESRHLRAERERTGKRGRPRTIYRVHPSVTGGRKAFTVVSGVGALIQEKETTSLSPTLTPSPPSLPALYNPTPETTVIAEGRSGADFDPLDIEASPGPRLAPVDDADAFSDPVPEWAEPADDDEPLSDGDVLADAIADLMDLQQGTRGVGFPLAPRDRRQRACAAARELLADHVDVLRAGGDEARALLERVAVEAWGRAELLPAEGVA